jgi:hypothetical protein
VLGNRKVHGLDDEWHFHGDSRRLSLDSMLIGVVSIWILYKHRDCNLCLTDKTVFFWSARYLVFLAYFEILISLGRVLDSNNQHYHSFEIFECFEKN